MAVREYLIKQARTDEERVIIGRALDIITRAIDSGAPQTTFFLDPNGQLLFEMAVKSYPEVQWEFDGGYEDAERRRMAIWPVECDWYVPEIDSSLIKINSLEPALLAHRDYLGALLGLGLKREVLGDIVIKEDDAYVVVDAKIADFILVNLVKIGSVTVSSELAEFADIEESTTQYEVVPITVVSLRLDSVIAKAFQLSRSAAANFIKQGRVKINHRIQTSPAADVAEGNTISCRGRGRCVVMKNAGVNKKGKYRLEIGFPKM